MMFSILCASGRNPAALFESWLKSFNGLCKHKNIMLLAYQNIYTGCSIRELSALEQCERSYLYLKRAVDVQYLCFDISPPLRIDL